MLLTSTGGLATQEHLAPPVDENDAESAPSATTLVYRSSPADSLPRACPSHLARLVDGRVQL